MHSAPRSCAKKKIIKAREAWISVSQQVEHVATPEVLPERIRKTPTHLDLAGGALYTQVELDRWREESNQEDYHQAILKSLSFGICINDGTCQANSQENPPNYSLDSLIPKVPHISDIFSKVHDFMLTWGGYMSACVLILESVKIFTFITLLLTTLWTEGVCGFTAICYLVCCSMHSNKNKYLEEPIKCVPSTQKKW